MTATVKRGDTVAITLYVTDADDVPVDLTDYSAVRIIASLSTNTEPGVALTPVVVTDAVAGEVQHQLDGLLPHGTYDIEFEYLDAAGVKITSPTIGYGTLVVLRDLDVAP